MGVEGQNGWENQSLPWLLLRVPTNDRLGIGFETAILFLFWERPFVEEGMYVTLPSVLP